MKSRKGRLMEEVSDKCMSGRTRMMKEKKKAIGSQEGHMGNNIK